jgi:hypothetical protein
MKKLIYTLIILCIGSLEMVIAQTEKPTLYINLNANTYLSSKPVKEATFGIGDIGLGLGVSRIQPIKSKLFLKYRGNISFNSYTDQVAPFKDPTGQSLGNILPSTLDFTLNLSTTINYSLSDNFAVGTGIGFRTLLHSASEYSTNQFKIETVNAHYKRVMPVLPIEMSLKISKVLLNLRYEYSILNKIRGDLSDYVTERFGIVSFEIGYKIR